MHEIVPNPCKELTTTDMKMNLTKYWPAISGKGLDYIKEKHRCFFLKRGDASVSLGVQYTQSSPWNRVMERELPKGELKKVIVHSFQYYISVVFHLNHLKGIENRSSWSS